MTATEAREAEYAKQLATLLDVPFVDLSAYRISAGILSKLAAATAGMCRSLPMVFNARRAVLVTDDPARAVYHSYCAEELGAGTRRVEYALTTPAAFEAALERRKSLPR